MKRYASLSYLYVLWGFIFLFVFLSSFQTEQFQRIELLLWQDLASTMMKHQINSVSWPNLIFPKIQSPTSNAFLKLHCRLHLRAKKMRWPWFSHNGLLHCVGYRLENSKDTIYIKSLWMYTVQHILWPYCQFIPTLNGSLLQYTKKKQNPIILRFTVLILYTLQLLTLG